MNNIAPLKKNDLIYLCAPAKAIDAELLFQAKTKFESLGFQVEIAPNASGSYNYFSGSPEDRLSDFQEGLNRSDVKAILCARGGYGCVHLTDKIDWTAFAQNPKWILGYSDVTNFHLEALSKGIPSIHSTMPLDFSSNTDAAFSTMVNALMQQDYSIKAQAHQENRFGTVKGEIIGGNLSILYALLSKHGKEAYRDKILFIEDIGEHVYQYDRMFQAFRHADIPRLLKGVMVGHFTNTKDTPQPFGRNIEELIADHFGLFGYPIGFNFPVGHEDDNQALVLGVETEFSVSAEESSVSFHF